MCYWASSSYEHISTPIVAESGYAVPRGHQRSVCYADTDAFPRLYAIPDSETRSPVRVSHGRGCDYSSAVRREFDEEASNLCLLLSSSAGSESVRSVPSKYHSRTRLERFRLHR